MKRASREEPFKMAAVQHAQSVFQSAENIDLLPKEVVQPK